jgi:hypothetical protein
MGYCLLHQTAHWLIKKQDAQDNQQKFVLSQQTENSNGERNDCML